tara:strand:+ start:212 stop:646 length:435 start_codon:yes stop_codon:yes gene_type:complete
MRTETINIYKIDEHPSKDKCFEWIRDNEHHIGDFEVEDLTSSIEKLSEAIGGTNEYCVSYYGDRSERITFNDYDEDLLEELNADECPLTGCFWDMELINALKAKDMGKVLETLHDCIEHLYSDEVLFEMCEDNDYEFYENGERV